jgi:hypothetical protein
MAITVTWLVVSFIMGYSLRSIFASVKFNHAVAHIGKIETQLRLLEKQHKLAVSVIHKLERNNEIC